MGKMGRSLESGAFSFLEARSVDAAGKAAASVCFLIPASKKEDPMRDSLQSYMQVGIVHFMAFPECMKGEGPIYDTLTKIVEDEFFSAVEITWIKDPDKARKDVEAITRPTLGSSECVMVGIPHKE